MSAASGPGFHHHELVIAARAVVLACAALVCCAGCGSRAADAVGAAAQDFYSALAEGDGAAACALLTPEAVDELQDSAEAECAEAVLEEDLPAASGVESIEVYGRNAQVVLDADTAFLTETREGWRLMGVGCVERPDRPYDCSVKGG